MTMLCFEILTLFPAPVRAFVGAGLLGKAIERGLIAVECTDIRAFATDKHRTVDDAPFGGGPGMVMKPDPVVAALEHVEAVRGPSHRVLLTPSAPRFEQKTAERLAKHDRITLLCGRYEGIDDRVREHFVHECLSIGDFVLNGGEVAALAIVEAIARLREGVLGNPSSLERESFVHDVGLEYPQYTRPAEFRGHAVPGVLLGGDHGAIVAWRRRVALARTWALRPELRPRPSLPPGLAIHLAVSTELVPGRELELVELAQRHRLAGILVLGDDPSPAVMAVARACGGRVPITGFPGLAAARRRFRQRHKTRVATVAVPLGPCESAVTDERVVLESVADLAGGVLIVALGDRFAAELTPVDVLFAPQAQRQNQSLGLAIRPLIDDSSPSSSPVQLAHQALVRLRAGDDRLPSKGETSP